MRPGDVGSMPIGSTNFDGPLSLGYRLSGKPRAGSSPASAARWLGFPSRLLSVVTFRDGSLCFGYRTGSSTASEHLVKTRRCGFDSRPETSKPPLVHLSNFDGSQDWVIVDNDEVAGSSPASGSKCRGSSVVERVIPSSFLYPSFLNRNRPAGTKPMAKKARLTRIAIVSRREVLGVPY